MAAVLRVGARSAPGVEVEGHDSTRIGGRPGLTRERSGPYIKGCPRWPCPPGRGTAGHGHPASRDRPRLGRAQAAHREGTPEGARDIRPVRLVAAQVEVARRDVELAVAVVL